MQRARTSAQRRQQEFEQSTRGKIVKLVALSLACLLAFGLFFTALYIAAGQQG